MGFLIDTCIWVDVERGALAPADVQSITSEQPVFISTVTIAELKFGAEMARSRDIRQKRLAAVSRLIQKPVLRIDEITGDIFGTLAAQLQAQGRGHDFRIQDIWLASQTLQHGLVLLTHNVKDFEDIPGLDVALMPG